MSKGINKVTLVGNLGKDPESRATGQGEHVVSFSVATSEYWQDRNTGERKERTEWHNCVAFRQTAQFVAQYLKKGDKVYVEGQIRTTSWDDQQSGQKKFRTEVIARDVVGLSERRSGGQAQQGYQGAATSPAAQQVANQQPYQPHPQQQPPPQQQPIGGMPQLTGQPQQPQQPPPPQQQQPAPPQQPPMMDGSFDDDIPF